MPPTTLCYCGRLCMEPDETEKVIILDDGSKHAYEFCLDPTGTLIPMDSAQ